MKASTSRTTMRPGDKRVSCASWEFTAVWSIRLASRHVTSTVFASCCRAQLAQLVEDGSGGCEAQRPSQTRPHSFFTSHGPGRAEF